MATPPRVLAAIRQSRRKDRSESPATQREAILRWAEQHGAVIVGEAVDVGVSASVSPFSRPELGPWLTDAHKLGEWDAIAVWKVDRLARSLNHWYGELVPRLTMDLGKRLVAVTEGVDTASSSAIEISIRVAIAEEELKKLTDRAKITRAGHRKRGSWAGGIPPFGLKPGPDGKLVKDPTSADALVRVVDMVLDGYNLNQATAWLNDHKVITAWDLHAARQGRPTKGRLWRRRTLEQILRSPHLLGYSLYQDEVIRDENNEPILFSEPLLDRVTYDRLQVAVNPETRSWVRRSDGAMLRHVAYCSCCGRPMYHRPERASDVRRYVCAGTSAPPGTRDCFVPSWRADDLELFVTEHFLESYGDNEIVKVKPLRADDPSARLAEIDDSLTTLETDRYVRGRFKGREDVFERLTDGLLSERAELQARQDAGTVLYEHTGITYRQEWESRDDNGKGDLLREQGVYVMTEGGRSPYMHLFMLYQS